MKLTKDKLFPVLNIVQALIYGMPTGETDKDGKQTRRSVGRVPAGAASKLGRIERLILPLAQTLQADIADHNAKFKDATADELEEGNKILTELLAMEVECPYVLKDADWKDAVIDPPELVAALSSFGLVEE